MNQLDISSSLTLKLSPQKKLIMNLELRGFNLAMLREEDGKLVCSYQETNYDDVEYQVQVFFPNNLAEIIKSIESDHHRVISLLKEKKYKIYFSRGIFSVTYRTTLQFKGFKIDGLNYRYSLSREDTPIQIRLSLIIPSHVFRSKYKKVEETYYKKIKKAEAKKKRREQQDIEGKLAYQRMLKNQSSTRATQNIMIGYSKDSFHRCKNCLNLNKNNICSVLQKEVKTYNICSRFNPPKVYHGGGFSPK